MFLRRKNFLRDFLRVHYFWAVLYLCFWLWAKKSNELGTRFNLTLSSSQKGQRIDLRISWEPTVGWNSLKFPQNFSLLQALFLLFGWLGADELADNGDDHEDWTNQFLWLKLPRTCTCTSYFSPSNQAEKGRVFYLVNKCFETRGDSPNFCNFAKCGRHVCRHFTAWSCMQLSCRVWELAPLCVPGQKTIGCHLNSLNYLVIIQY